MSLAKRFKIGDKVILGRHDKDSGMDAWVPMMDQYVGKETTITRDAGERGGFVCWYVAIDGGYCFWREVNMSPANGCGQNTMPKGPAPICKKCHEVAEYADPNDNFICYRCKHY
jgi:hypothetical protein